MAIKVVTSWTTLMHLAKELGQARLSGDEERIAKAKEEHDNYVKICLEADEMIGLDLNYILRR